MLNLNRRLCAYSIVAAMPLVFTGCGGGGSSSTPSTPAVTAPTIVTPPANVGIAPGGTATFTVVAAGTDPLTYAWNRNGTAIPSATSASYQLTGATLADNGASFTVTVQNSAGSITSSAALLSVADPAVLNIVTQPADQRATAGSTATFSVTATGSAAITYQWYQDGTPVGTNSNYYNTSVVSILDGGSKVYVKLTCGSTSVSSNTATLTYDSSIDSLVQTQSGGSSYSSLTPMGIHYEGRHVTVASDLVTLADPTVEPPIPPSAPSLHLATFPVTLYPSGDPIPADINQHALGDCDGDSALASLAYMAPSFVKSIIKDMGNGTFQVNMFDPMGTPIVVALSSSFLSDSSGNIGAVSGKGGIADWATVLEKAAMKYNTIYHVNDDIGGIGSESMTPLFTGVGNSYAFGRGVLAPADLTKVIEASLAAGKLITGGFGNEIQMGNDTTVTGHGYACYWPSDANTMLDMRNPWGVNPTPNSGYDTTTDGVLDVPITTAWAQDIDLRIVDPGVAGSAGRTTPYAPTPVQIQSGSAVHIAPGIAKGGTRP